MPKLCGKYLIFSADDEMPNCISCDHFGDNFDCDKTCGAKHGWYGYKRTVDIQNLKERSEIND